MYRTKTSKFKKATSQHRLLAWPKYCLNFMSAVMANKVAEKANVKLLHFI